MEEIRRKQRYEILSRDKNISSEIHRRVQRQTSINNNVLQGQTNEISTDIETEGEALSISLNAVLDSKVFDLEQIIQGTIPTTGNLKDATIRRLLINSDFIQAFNKLVKFINSSGKNEQSKEYLNKILFKSEDGINSCVYGYKKLFDDAITSPTTAIGKLAYQVFQAYAIYAFAQDMIKSKNVRPIVEKDLNFHMNKLFNEQSKQVQDDVLKANKKSASNILVKSDYEQEIEKQEKLLGRDLSPDEEESFRMLYFSKRPQNINLELFSKALSQNAKLSALQQTQQQNAQAQQTAYLQQQAQIQAQNQAQALARREYQRISDLLTKNVDTIAGDIYKEMVVQNAHDVQTQKPIFDTEMIKAETDFQAQEPTVAQQQLDDFKLAVMQKTEALLIANPIVQQAPVQPVQQLQPRKLTQAELNQEYQNKYATIPNYQSLTQAQQKKVRQDVRDELIQLGFTLP